MVRIGLYLFAQALDESTQVVDLVAIIGSPNCLQQFPVRHGFIGMLGEVSKQIDFAARTVTRGAISFHLTPTELDLLKYLTQHPNEAVPHRELLQAVWGPDYGDQVDYLRAFIKSLRKKIEPDPDHPHYITTEPWIGYRFNGTPEPS